MQKMRSTSKGDGEIQPTSSNDWHVMGGTKRTTKTEKLTMTLL